MSINTLSYFALVDSGKSPGVLKKINNTIVSAQNNGLSTQEKIFPTNINGVYCFLKSLVFLESDVAIIRFSDLVFPVAFFVMIYLRIKGKKIVVDVPTPRIVALKEIDSQNSHLLIKVIRKFITYISSSWVLLPATLVVQYADEGRWFSLGISHKVKKMGNGILITDDVPLTQAVWPSDSLNLVAVAQLADWHGYDRMLRALAKLNSYKLPFEINFTIVGDGDALPNLKKVVNELKLTNVFFTGQLSGKELDSVFEYAHIGISSLGLYRKCLDEASDLKTREYMARGLNVIGAGTDPDFDSSCPFRFQAENSNEIESLVKIICSFDAKFNISSPSEIREYARNELSLDSKVKSIVEILE